MEKWRLATCGHGLHQFSYNLIPQVDIFLVTVCFFTKREVLALANVRTDRVWSVIGHSRTPSDI